ncbi:hypothetical protein CL656_02530 [bacterium]|nr:hypothetical protein [bacterium]
MVNKPNLDNLFSFQPTDYLQERKSLHMIKRSESISLISLKILTGLDNTTLKRILSLTSLDLIYEETSKLNPGAFWDKDDFLKLYLVTMRKIDRITEKEPEAIIFDCDGTLVNTEEINDITLHKIGAKRNIPYNAVDKIINATKGMMFREPFFSTIREINRNFITEPDDFRQEYRAISRTLKRELGIQPSTGSTNIIQSGIEFIVASNTPKIIMEENARALQIPSHKMLSAHDLPDKKGKPSPKLFLLAAEKLNSTPDKTLVIEDSKTGIEAGLKGGFEVIIFNNGSNQEIISQYPELLSISDLSVLQYIIRHKDIFSQEEAIKRKVLANLQRTLNDNN